VSSKTQTSKPLVPLADEPDPMMRLIKRLTYQHAQAAKRTSVRGKATAALLAEELAFLVG
jgi:hypothetical protein